jgi:hypothetical protein
MTIDVRDQAAYDELQKQLVPLWSSLDHLNDDSQTIVVVPSAEIDFELSPSELQAYEERYLFLLFLLRQPRARMIYVTGQTIAPEIIDYYLDLLPGVISSHARKRLFLVSPMEATFRPLSQKLLDRPRLIEHIRSLIVDHDRAHLVPFMATWSDRELAMHLGIPMYGADPALAHLGTKTEGRRLFAAAGIDHPAGREDLADREAVVRAISEMREQHPGLGAVVVKTNEGVGGFGNITMQLGALPEPGSPDEAASIDAELETLDLGLDGLSIDDYFAAFVQERGIVEELIVADELRSPSVQLRITPLGNVELLSTHDQILGGPTGQTFVGSRFPADPGYAVEISEAARLVGEQLVGRGVIGRFAIDFVVARAGGSWRTTAIELNLRKGGTTQPFLTLQFLTDGTYDPTTAEFMAPNGVTKHYVASDHLESAALRAFTPNDLFDVALMEKLHFDQTRQVGTVFHMMSALPAHGRVGVTCVGNSAEEAQELYERTERVVLRAAQAATRP